MKLHESIPDWEKYLIWNRTTGPKTFDTIEEVTKEAVKRAKRNKFGCEIYIQNPNRINSYIRFRTVTI